jgi:carbamoyltransferase
MVAVAHEAQRETGERRLCMAGGVALNCVANHHVATSGAFDNVYVQPAAGDAGGAMGSALWATHVLHGIPRQFKVPSACLGTAYHEEHIRTFLDDCGVMYRAYSSNDDLFGDVANRLSMGQVAGWFRGRFEWGPRALGARSILADPRSPTMKDRVNQKIKFRESFRPFAPAVLAEKAQCYFDIQPSETLLAEYMLSVLPVSAYGQEQLPAITHVDGSARAQLVRRETNPDFHRLLSAFHERTGVPVLINTSLNLKDEPICSSPAEAYGMFLRSELDFLVLENCVVERRPDQP